MYCLDHLVLTSLEYDHADIFTDVEAIKNEFRAIIPQVKGNLIFSQDYVATQELAQEFSDAGKAKLYFYGENAAGGPFKIKTATRGSEFSLHWKGLELTFNTNIIGKHNVLNLSAVVIFALQEGFATGDIQKAIKHLTLAKRRQEVRGLYHGSLVIDDFAHHPRAVDLTIDAIRAQYPDKKIIVILEPNSATARSDVFQQDFVPALAKADEIILAKPEKPTTAIGRQDLNLEQLAQDLFLMGRPAQVVDRLDILKAKLAEKSGPHNLLLVLSNGTCLGLWESEFVQELK